MKFSRKIKKKRKKQKVRHEFSSPPHYSPLHPPRPPIPLNFQEVLTYILNSPTPPFDNLSKISYIDSNAIGLARGSATVYRESTPFILPPTPIALTPTTNPSPATPPDTPCPTTTTLLLPVAPPLCCIIFDCGYIE